MKEEINSDKPLLKRRSSTGNKLDMIISDYWLAGFTEGDGSFLLIIMHQDWNMKTM